MKILINASIIKRGGGLQVVHSLINELSRFPKNQYCVLMSSNVEQILKSYDFPDNFVFYLVPSSPAKIISRQQTLKRIRQIEKHFNPDVVFTVFGPAYWKPKAPHLCGYAIPHFIYPESPFFAQISQYATLKWGILKYLKFFFFKNESEFFVTETVDVANRLSTQLNVSRDKIFIVANAYNSIFDEPDRWANIEGTFPDQELGYKLLTVSANYPHKNLQIIPAVIDYLTDRYPNFSFTFLLSLTENEIGKLTPRQKKHIRFLGSVHLEECPPLYRKVDALFLPTLLECFTVSYLESMRSDTPILTSDLPFAHDICKGAAVYFDPLDPQDIGENIVALAKDHHKQKDLIARGRVRLNEFGNAKGRAEEYLKILQTIVGYTTIN